MIKGYQIKKSTFFNCKSKYSILFVTMMLGLFVHPFDANAQRSKRKEIELKEKQVQATNEQVEDLYFNALKYKLKGNVDSTILLLEEYIVQVQTNAAAYFELSIAQAKRYEFDKGKFNAQKAMDLDSTNKWYIKNYADFLANNKDYSASASYYVKVAKLDIDPEESMIIASTLYQNAKKWDEALSVLDDLEKLKGESTESLLNEKRKIYYQLNDIGNVIDMTNQLLTKNPENPEYYKFLVEIYYNKKFYKEADSVLNVAVKKFPQDVVINEYYQLYYFEMRDEERIGKMVNQILSPKADSSQLVNFWRNLNIVYYQDTTSTILDLVSKKINGFSAKDVNLLHKNYSIAMIAVYKNQIEEAKKYNNLLLKEFPNNFNSYFPQILMYTKLEDKQSIWKTVLIAEKNLPNNLDLVSTKIALASELYPDSMIVYLNDAVKKTTELGDDEAQVEFLGMLAYQYYNNKNFELSDSLSERALKIDEKNAAILNNYSYSLAERSVKLEEALEMSAKSLEKDNKNLLYIDTYGYILHQMKRYKDAYTVYVYGLKLVENDKDSLTLLRHLRETCVKLKDKNMIQLIDGILSNVK